MQQTNGLDMKKWLKAIGKIKKIKITALAGLIAVISIGCSGGGSGSGAGVDSAIGAAPLVEGIFVDSPVEGLDYMTQTHTGITDAEGRFTCFEGEMITFMIGDVMLGQALADDVITPMNFLDASEMPFDVTHPMITNMGRFLQSLDSDGDPENGITISAEVREEISGRMIDFYQSIEDFENDPDVVACFDVLNGLNTPHNGMMWNLVAAEDAQQHMIAYMGEYMGLGSSDGLMDGQMGEYMGSGSSDEFVDGQMGEYMDDYMGFGDSGSSGGDFDDHPMGDYMGSHM